MSRIMSLDATDQRTEWTLLAPTKRQFRATKLLLDRIALAAPESDVGRSAAFASESLAALINSGPRQRVAVAGRKPRRDARMLAVPKGDRT